MDNVIRDLAKSHALVAPGSATGEPPKSTVLDDVSRQLLKQLADEGAELELTTSPTEFIIAGRRVKLTPKLATLLKLLAEETEGDGRLVGWKSAADVAAQLKVSRHNLNQLVYRLREKFHDCAVNRFLVQSRPDGLRFARRVNPPPEVPP